LQYLNAITACCAIGMQLLDLHQTFIYDNLVQIMQSERQIPKSTFADDIFTSAANLTTITADVFWTAGTDDGSEGNFGFATTNTILTKDAKCRNTKFTEKKIFNISYKMEIWSTRQRRRCRALSGCGHFRDGVRFHGRKLHCH
jgi:hypothetical protein